MLKSKEVSGDQKTQSITVVSTESSVMVTRTDTRSYSDVLKSDKNSESKHLHIKATQKVNVETD